MNNDPSKNNINVLSRDDLNKMKSKWSADMLIQH
jgi:hypothetical protein